MEVRKIIVISSANQSQHVINTDATTLGELKRDLDAKGINYEGMTFLEGRTKTEMNLDDAILPTNVPYKDGNTNELVFLLTTPQKKIKSGADRKALYNTIKVSGLSGAIRDYYGKNYTNVSTDDLEWYVNNMADTMSVEEPSKPCEECEEEEFTIYDALRNVYTALTTLTDTLEKKGLVVIGGIAPKEEEPKEDESPISDEEYNDLFGNML